MASVSYIQAKKYLVICSILLLSTPLAQASTTYTLTQLNALEATFNGYTDSHALDINASGQVVGYVSTNGGRYRAVLWHPGSSTPIDLGAVGNRYSHASAINDNGVIVGDSKFNGSDVVRAVTWQPGETSPTALGGLGSHAYAKDINNAGQIVGEAYIKSQYDAVVWQAGSSTPTNIGGQRALGINAFGQVGGRLDSQGAVFWDTSLNTPMALPILGGDGAGQVEDINESGSVVGWTRGPSGNLHAFFWQVGDSALTDLGTLFGTSSSSSYAYGINASGQIVGSSSASTSGSGPQHATLWDTSSGAPVDLNTLVMLSSGYLSEARAINDAGQIIANASNGRAFLLTPNASPVPVPSAVWLFGTGLMGLFGLKRRGQAS